MTMIHNDIVEMQNKPSFVEITIFVNFRLPLVYNKCMDHNNMV